jgi:hypothetical protein
MKRMHHVALLEAKLHQFDQFVKSPQASDILWNLFEYILCPRSSAGRAKKKKIEDLVFSNLRCKAQSCSKKEYWYGTPKPRDTTCT